MRRHEINFIVSSDPDNGAKNVNALGNRFEVVLDEPILVPQQAENITVSMEEATVWWTVPNIITGTNDLMQVTDTGAGAAPSGGPANVYNIVIPQGLYDLSALNEAIQREIGNDAGGAGFLDPPLISLSADDATQKVEININYTGVSIDFTIAQTFREILGFNSAVVGPPAAAPTVYLADNTAAFNTVNSFLIHSDIVRRGVRFNNSYQQILDQVLIDVPPGSQIVQTKLRPPVIPEHVLAGIPRNTLKFWLTNESNEDISTAGEYFTVRFVIRYDTPMGILGGRGRY